MRENRSPWLHQLDKERKEVRLDRDIETDVAIIGAGIAGVATAFFALKYTGKRVALIERYKMAHGATGHNAGQVVSYFERGFASLAEEFGHALAARGQLDIEGAWELFDEMYSDGGLDIPFSRFIGHGGLTSYDQVIWHLKNNKERLRAGLHIIRLEIARSAPFADDIPVEYAGLYDIVPHSHILQILETKIPEFIAATSSQKGCVNSALFCQEVVRYLLKQYPDRFAIYEHAPVHKVVLRTDHALIDADTYTVTAQRVALCTNGFENLHIINETGLDIDARYHHLISGKVGYMSSYLEKMNKLPTAISYYSDAATGMDSIYFYLTRRPYEYEKGTKHNLISIGGPEKDLEETAPYVMEDEYPEDMGQKIDEFVHQVYNLEPNKQIEYVFTWHGLMGYTKNGVRLVGPEPQNDVLLYNLGCNGIGILPSIYGGKKISRHLAGEHVEKTIFDVPARIHKPAVGIETVALPVDHPLVSPQPTA